MPDFGAPVATSVNVSPAQGIQTLSGLLGLRQQQQGLALQQQELQVGEQRVFQAKRIQAAQSFMSNLMQSGKDEQGNSIMGPDGQPDAGKTIAAVSRNLPTDLAQPVVQNILQSERNRVGLQAASAELDANERKMLMGPVQALVGGGKSSDAIEGIDNLVAAHPEMANAAGYLKGLVSHIDNVPPAQRVNAINTIAAKMQPGEAVPTVPTPAEVSTGSQIIQGTRAPAVAGGGFAPSTAVQAQLPPTVVTNPLTQAPTVVGGGAPPGALPGMPTQPGQVPNVEHMAGDDASRYAQISHEGTNAQTGAQLADQVAQLADQVRTGKYSKEGADLIAVLRQHSPGATDRQLLQKFAAQLKTTADATAATDASRAQIEQGMPSPETMTPDAIERAAEYVGGIFRMRGARQAYADTYVKRSGNSLGVRGADDAFMSAADPTIFSYNALPAGEARQKFLKERFGSNANAIRAFVSRSNQVKHYAAGIE